MTETIDSTMAFGRPGWEPAGDEMPAELDGPKLLVGTRKGAWLLASDSARERWAIAGPMFLGHIIQHLVVDPRPDGCLLAACRTGHLGPTVFRSSDLGSTWSEATKPPAFAEGDAHGRSLNSVFWLTPGPADQPGRWYAGGSPQGLFRSDDHGDTWQPVAGWNDHPRWGEWAEWPDVEGTPDGSMLHSVLVDPREGGDIGFPIDLHPRDPDPGWVFPMDGTDVWPRTSPDGRPAAYVTRDAGESWTRLDRGLPTRGWLTVKRQAMTLDDRDPVGVYFGTTSGEIWASADEGESWHRIAEHLPEIYS